MRGSSFVRYGYAPEGDRKGSGRATPSPRGRPQGARQGEGKPRPYISAYHFKGDSPIESFLWCIVSCVDSIVCY